MFIRNVTRGKATPIPTNRNAILSLSAGVLSLVSLCVGVIPVPLTGFLCFPVSAILCVLAIATGTTALRQIAASGEDGRGIALAGVILGGVAVAAGICIAVLGVAILIQLAHTIRATRLVDPVGSQAALLALREYRVASGDRLSRRLVAFLWAGSAVARIA